MKLTQAKLVRTLNKLADGKTVYQARKVADVSVRRIYQVREAFDKTGRGSTSRKIYWMSS